ncbi:glutamate--tRNA ligase, partial [bacterium]|nr:glutamate--tRNA ligase [bacterium]
MGNARTALFNWLLARRLGGDFVLRVEDTDAERTEEEHVAALCETLDWLGLSPDEGPLHGGQHGPYRQSQRLVLHHASMDDLLASGHAFWSPAGAGEAERFDRAWRDRGLTKAEADKIGPSALRFKSPLVDAVEIADDVRGSIKIKADQIGDFVIARTDKTPLYNFACVVDDHAMEISHVVRGEDHLTNTAKQVLMYKAFGWDPPAFIHLPLVMGPDGSPLSKRHGVGSIQRLREEGILPQAIVNHLALLGWGPGDDRELFTLDEMVPLFDVARINRGAAKFFPKKLRWFNGQHLRRLPPLDLAEHLAEWLGSAGIYQTPENLLRISVGIEDASDLIDDLAQA